MLSVRGSRELRAAVLALRAARREVRNDINRATRQTLAPIWKQEVGQRARTTQDQRVLARGARIAAGNPPSVVAASSRRALSGGLVPVESWHAVEFGANRDAVTTYQRTSPGGVVHQVTRHTRRGLPPRYRSGRVLYPAVAGTIPRLAALWVQLIVRKFNEAAETGGR